MLCFKSRRRLTTNDLFGKIREIHRRFPGCHLPVSEVVTKLFDAIDMLDESNWTTLHYSAYIGLDQACSRLLTKGADVNKTTSCGDTPLHLACLKANYACIEAILGSKPDLNIQNDGLNTPLNLLTCRRPQREDILNKLLDAGAHPDISDEDGYTPLHTLAIQIYNEKTIIFARLLLEYNANINSENKFKETPLHIALNENAEELVKVFLECGASIDNPDVSGTTPMDLAIQKKTRYPRIFDHLAKQLIFQYYSGFSVNSRHLEEVSKTEGYQDYRKRCEEEIQRLKNTRAGEGTVTYHDILVSPIHRIARYLCNRNILVKLLEFDMDEFIFGPLLAKKFQEGLKRYHGMKLGISAAMELFPFLPGFCIEELIGYLDIEDCINLDKACSF